MVIRNITRYKMAAEFSIKEMDMVGLFRAIFIVLSHYTLFSLMLY